MELEVGFDCFAIARVHVLLVFWFSGPLNSIVENFNKYMGKAEVLAGNIWSHSK